MDVLESLKQQLNLMLAISASCHSFEQTEQQLQNTFLASARELLEKQLSLYDPGDSVVSISGKDFRRVLTQNKTYQSLLGPLRIERGLYRSKKGEKTICPLESLSGIVGGFWTPNAAKKGTLFLTEMPSVKTKALLGEIGLMQPSSSALDQLPKQISSTWEAKRAAF